MTFGLLLITVGGALFYSGFACVQFLPILLGGNHVKDAHCTGSLLAALGGLLLLRRTDSGGGVLDTAKKILGAGGKVLKKIAGVGKGAVEEGAGKVVLPAYQVPLPQRGHRVGELI